MKKNNAISAFFIFINLLLISPCFCENSIVISVIVPCDRAHLQYLPKLLSALEIQSYIPDEIIISISNSTNQDDLIIEQIQQSNFRFAVKILRSAKRQFAGENRNIAIANATGDLIVCQDADDLPHKQRIEIIKNIFQKTNFDYLLHLFLAPTDESMIDPYIEYYNHIKFPKNVPDFLVLDSSLDMYALENMEPEFMKKFLPNEIKSKVGVHFGNCAFKRSVFDMIHYNHYSCGEDVTFFVQVLEKFKKNILINLPLVYYIRPRGTYFLGRDD